MTADAESPAPDDAAVAPSLTATLDVDWLRVVRGEAAVVSVRLERVGDVGPVVVAAEGLPAGMAATPLSLPEGVAEANVVIEVTDAAAHGGPFDFEVRVRSTAESVEAVRLRASLVVAGGPGELDESFGDGSGVSVADVGFPFQFLDLDRDADGRILLGGQTPTYESSSGTELLVSRLTPEGALDVTLGDGGSVVRREGRLTRVESIVSAGDGSFRVVGRRQMTRYDDEVERFVYRMRDDGGVAIVTELLGFDDESTHARAVMNGGDLVIGLPSDLGRVDESDNFEVWEGPVTVTQGPIAAHDGYVTLSMGSWTAGPAAQLARVDADGRFDPSFGTNGLLVLASPLENRERSLAEALVLDPSGGGYVALSHQNGTRELVEVVRFTGAGELDRTFASEGRLAFPGDRSLILNLFVDNQARLIVHGYMGERSAREPEIRRYRPNGTLDSTFADRGVLRLDPATMPPMPLAAHDAELDRLVGCDATDVYGIVRCVRLWL
tara:strand:+ start:1792 stop:3279 length:1488 start_codon:yes stop_codon:yes gene_type:complete